VLYLNTLYDSVTGRRRMLLHARIGEVLERRVGQSHAPAPAELAVHFDRGRQTAKAVDYYMAAAEAALAKFAHAQALTYCDRALALAESLPAAEKDERVLHGFETRGRILFALGRFDGAVDDFQSMIAAGERLGRPEAVANGLFEQSMSLFWGKRDEELEDRIAKMLELAREQKLPGGEARARVILATSRVVYGHLDEGSELLRQVEHEAQGEAFRPLLTHATVWQGEVDFFKSDYDKALPKLRRGLALARETHDGFSFLMSRFFLGLTQVNRGYAAEGMASLEQGLREAEQSHDTFWLGRFPNCRAWVYHEAFDYERALELNREGAIIAQETGFTEPEANAKINVGLLALKLEDKDLARRSFTEVDRLFAGDDWFKWRYRLRLELGWSELGLMEGNLEEARRRAEACRVAAAAAPCRKYMAQAHAQLGRIAMAADELGAAERHLRQATDLVADLTAPLIVWKIQSAMADFYQATRRYDDARTWRVSALQILRFLALHAPEKLQDRMLASAEVRRLSA